MARLRFDNLSSSLGASLTDSATTATLAAALEYGDGTPVPTIAGDDFLVLAIVDAAGTIEIVYVTDYTTETTTITAMTRGREGTAAVAHDDGTALRHAPTARDFDGNWLREVDGAYPTRADDSTIAIFAGTTDPGPDGLDIMLDGDAWVDLSGEANDASAIAVTPFGTIAATNVQDALEEIVAEAGGGGGGDAASITFTPAAGIAATDVQAAIVEDAGDLAAHLSDATDAHDASAISFSPTGSISATDVQAAIAEVASEAAGGGSSGGILAITSHDPQPTASVYSIASATVTDVDATNLAVTFTVPASGKVLVTLNAVATNHGSSTTNWLSWHLRESTTTIASQFMVSLGTAGNWRLTAQFYITGLTPSASKTYKWAHSRNSTGTASTHAGGADGAAVMTVFGAP